MRKLIRQLLALLDLELKRKGKKELKLIGEIVNPNTMHGALSRLKSIGIQPETVVDVGAAVGMWTQNAMKVWPDSKYYLVEPLVEQASKLIELKNGYSNIFIYEGVAGEKKGNVLFSVSDDLDGSGVYGNQAENIRQVPVATIDEIVGKIEGSVLIKLDTHGYEVPILKGASATLENTVALIIEVYGFHVSPTGLLFHQLSTYMETLGFRLFDIVDVMRRESDNAFWQADAVYLRSDNPVFNKARYK